MTRDAYIWIVACASTEVIGKRFPLDKEQHVIGRAPESDVRVPDEAVSRAHCKLVCVDGRYRIEDLGSENGTFVNGKPVSDCLLEPGDRVELGTDTVIEFGRSTVSIARSESHTSTTTVPIEQRLGRYELLRRVGQGGMAEVWKARVRGPAGFEKFVAVKRILPKYAEDALFVSMFIQEARLVAGLIHPNVVQVHDFGLSDTPGAEIASYYAVMEYVPGRDLRPTLSRLQQRGDRMPLLIALHIARSVAEALAHVHEARDQHGHKLGIVHRDVSPSNILLSYDGDVKVADFGVAKVPGAGGLTRVGVLKGKRPYMSPEQVLERPLDARSDIFALGLVFYEILTHVRLFEGKTTEEVIGFAGLSPEQKKELPSDIATIVDRCLQPDPDKRYPDCSDLAAALGQVLGGPGVNTAAEALSSLMRETFPKGHEAERSDQSSREIFGGDTRSDLQTLADRRAPPGVAQAVDDAIGSIGQAAADFASDGMATDFFAEQTMRVRDRISAAAHRAEGLELIVGDGTISVDGYSVRHSEARRLAQRLDDLRIAAVYIPSWVPAAELWRFLTLISVEPEKVLDCGGLTQSLEKAGCLNIQVHSYEDKLENARALPGLAEVCARVGEGLEEAGQHLEAREDAEARLYGRLTRSVTRAFRCDGPDAVAHALLVCWQRLAVAKTGSIEAALVEGAVAETICRIEPLVRFSVCCELARTSYGIEVLALVDDHALAGAITSALVWHYPKALASTIELMGGLGDRVEVLGSVYGRVERLGRARLLKKLQTRVHS